MTNNYFENLVEQEVDIVLDTAVKSSFYQKEWCSGTLFINGVAQSEMDQVLSRLSEVYGNVLMNRMGDTDEYAFDFALQGE